MSMNTHIAQLIVIMFIMCNIQRCLAQSRIQGAAGHALPPMRTIYLVAHKVTLFVFGEFFLREMQKLILLEVILNTENPGKTQKTGILKMLWIFFQLSSIWLNLRKLSIARSRGRQRRRVQILSISCSFLQKKYKIISIWEFGVPPGENPGSATAKNAD